MVIFYKTEEIKLLFLNATYTQKKKILLLTICKVRAALVPAFIFSMHAEGDPSVPGMQNRTLGKPKGGMEG